MNLTKQKQYDKNINDNEKMYTANEAILVRRFLRLVAVAAALNALHELIRAGVAR